MLLKQTKVFHLMFFNVFQRSPNAKAKWKISSLMTLCNFTCEVPIIIKRLFKKTDITDIQTLCLHLPPLPPLLD